MGIPHLTAHLLSYAKEKSLKGEDVVIDGPALAYHIYHLCITSRSGAKNPFEAAPTYRELGESVIKWLDLLESYQVSVKKIFFDGFLPLSKREVRISRLEMYTRQLSTYSAVNQPTLPCSKTASQNLTPKNQLNGQSFSIANSIPAATFLVPAIIDALFSSEKYRLIAQVVPSEADTFCAAYVRENSGLIFTGDSDLLVYDLGDFGSVVFFRNINLSLRGRESDDSDEELSCQCFNPRDIVGELKLPKDGGLRNFAFALSMDQYATFGQLLVRSRDEGYLKSHREAYGAFCADYDSHPAANKKIDSIPQISKLLEASQILQTLHPRLSEFVLQFPTFSRLAWDHLNLKHPFLPPPSNSIKGEEDTRTREIFLPFILDNPQHTSAWDLSTEIRLIAYSLLNLVVSGDERIGIVIERRRQENGSKGRSWVLPTLPEIIKSSKSLISIFQGLRKKLPTIEGNEIWRAYAIYIDLENSREKGKAALSERLCGVGGRKGKRKEFKNEEIGAGEEVGWGIIHHIAHLHSTYYSLHLLSQIMTLIFSLPISIPSNINIPFLSSKNFKVRQHLSELQCQLTDLPPLAALDGFHEERLRTGSRKMREMVEVGREIPGVDIDGGREGKEEVMVEKREMKRRKRGVGEKGREMRMSNNSFEALVMDDEGKYARMNGE